jgi:hypothetical protein
LKPYWKSSNASRVSKARSYKEIGEYWDVHDLSESWDKTRPVRFGVDIESEVTYVAIDLELSEEIRTMAARRGVSTDTLVNLWIQEKLRNKRRRHSSP